MVGNGPNRCRSRALRVKGQGIRTFDCFPPGANQCNACLQAVVIGVVRKRHMGAGFEGKEQIFLRLIAPALRLRLQGNPLPCFQDARFRGNVQVNARRIPQHVVVAEGEPIHPLRTHHTVMAHIKRVRFDRNIPMHRRIRGELGRASLDLRVDINRRLILPLRLPRRADIKGIAANR